MTSTTRLGGHDAPVVHQADDLLNRWSVARAVDRAIASAPEGWSTRIGLYGPWGGGKTSVLRFLRTLTEERGDIIVDFSAWQAQGEGGVVRLFHEELLKVLKARNVKTEPWTSRWKRRLSGVARVGEELGAAGARAAGAADGDVGQLISAVSLAMSTGSTALGGIVKLTPADLEKLQKALGERRVVVFIDDLDRADPRLVPKTLLALRELLDWPNFAFVLAFDKRVVASALSEYSKAFGESADDFLEKVVDVPFELPEPTPSQVAALALDAMDALCPFIPLEARETASSLFPSNPRQAKQVVRSLSTLKLTAERHDPGELNWVAIELQTILRLAAPDVAAAFEAQPIGAEIGPFSSQEERTASLVRIADQALEKDAKLQQLPQRERQGRQAWLLALMTEIQLVRRSESAERRAYEMRLVVDEPPFTHREVRQIAERVLASPTAVNLRAEISRAVRRSNETHAASALDLVSTSIVHLRNANNSLAATLSGTRIAAARAAVEQALRLVEFLWSSEEPNIVRTWRTFIVGRDLLGVTNAFAVRAEGAATLALLERQVQLSLACAKECEQPWDMYFLTVPSRGESRSAKVREIVAAVRTELEPMVVALLLAMFSRRDGLELAFRKDAELKRFDLNYILQTPDSPLYIGGARQRLIDLFDMAASEKTEAAEVVIKNATRFLSTIGMMTTSDGWIADYPAFAALHGSILKAAWLALLNEDEEFRSAPFLRRLRNELSNRGLPIELFEEPGWMSAAPMVAEVATTVSVFARAAIAAPAAASSAGGVATDSK